jgi:hypothetical protein
MTRGTLKLGATALIVLAASAVAALERREQRSVFVVGGREARIASYAVPNQACESAAEPQIQILDRPSYGRLGTKPVRIIAEPSVIRQRDHPCIGKFVDATAVVYQSVGTFRGSDRVRLRVRFGGMTLEEEILINVQ